MTYTGRKINKNAGTNAERQEYKFRHHENTTIRQYIELYIAVFYNIQFDRVASVFQDLSIVLFHSETVYFTMLQCYGIFRITFMAS